MTQNPVYINGRFLTQPATGVQRFASELLNALDLVLENKQIGTEVICLIPNKAENILLPKWKNICIQKCGRLNGNLWEQLELSFYARRGLLIDLCNIGPILHLNQIVVFHDASVFAVPQTYSLAFKMKYRFIMGVLSHTARRILTVSQFSKKELARYLKLNEERITVISEGCEHILKTSREDSILNDRRLPHTPFLFAVGSAGLHKNLTNVIKAIEANGDHSIPLVIAGGSFSKVFKNAKNFDSKNIVPIGYVTDGTLRTLYSLAVGFIFPSVYEGFGLPPLEAMACGCPVICSNRASMPEICGDAALYFDPLNIADIQFQIQRLANDPLLQETLRQKGFLRAQQFTWEGTAQSFLNILETFLFS